LVAKYKTAEVFAHPFLESAMTNLQTKVLETKRLLLRHLAPDDLDDLFAFYCEGQVSQYIPDAPKSYEETKEELDWIITEYYGRYGFGVWGTILKETGAFIGRCGLIPWTIEEREEVEVAYALKRKYWGQGLEAEAAQAIVQYGFEHLHFARLICMIPCENHASIRIARKIGMIFEKEVEVDDKRIFLFFATKSTDSQR
jgi:[ribosomal protein S5]-alanine N-acetyltransferase